MTLPAAPTTLVVLLLLLGLLLPDRTRLLLLLLLEKLPRGDIAFLEFSLSINGKTRQGIVVVGSNYLDR